MSVDSVMTIEAVVSSLGSATQILRPALAAGK
jgi:hypothetical protein